MPRKPRQYSNSKIYHVIFRGNDKQDLFYNDQDRIVFLNRIKESKNKFKFQIFAYCLMSNHVHLVIRVKDEFLSKSMHNLGIRYSMYLNRKLERTGHAFENRYFSKNVENLKYFIDVCKYVHRNPEKANIELTEKYKWSSFQDYLKQYDNIVDRKILLHYFEDNFNKLKEYTLKNDDKEKYMYFSDFEMIQKIGDDDLSNIIKEKYGLNNASDVSLLEEDQKKKIIKELMQMKGVSMTQISRVTKVNKYQINKYQI